jgi:citrate lyase subunit beta/citryl-CoA lyase
MTVPTALACRSLLFLPGTEPALLAKVPRWTPDAVVVDLEDAVPPAMKSEARGRAVDAIRSTASLGPTAVLLRVNPPETPWHQDDLAAAAAAGVSGIVLPKYEHSEHYVRARAFLDDAGAGSVTIVAGIETALGVADARGLLATGVTAAYFGAEDYIVDLGGERGPDNLEVLYARSKVALAGRLAGIPVIDQAVVSVRDHERYEREALAARRLGYSGKICIHPDQVAVAHRAFTPSTEQVAHAQAVLQAVADGVSVLDGQMIDEVHRRMAARILQMADDRFIDHDGAEA